MISIRTYTNTYNNIIFNFLQCCPQHNPLETLEVKRKTNGLILCGAFDDINMQYLTMEKSGARPAIRIFSANPSRTDVHIINTPQNDLVDRMIITRVEKSISAPLF